MSVPLEAFDFETGSIKLILKLAGGSLAVFLIYSAVCMLGYCTAEGEEALLGRFFKEARKVRNAFSYF